MYKKYSSNLKVAMRCGGFCIAHLDTVTATSNGRDFRSRTSSEISALWSRINDSHKVGVSVPIRSANKYLRFHDLRLLKLKQATRRCINIKECLSLGKHGTVGKFVSHCDTVRRPDGLALFIR